MYSLKDLNLRLKMKKVKKEKSVNSLIYLVWVNRINKNEYFTEAPTLNKYKNIWPRNKCPHCEAIYKNENKIREDSVSWVFKCPGCNTLLEVYKN
jgi:transposase-like protein